MPGHVKKSSGPDPDPSHWLYVSYDLKQKLKVTKKPSESSNSKLVIFLRLSLMTPRSHVGSQTKPPEASMRG